MMEDISYFALLTMKMTHEEKLKYYMDIFEPIVSSLGKDGVVSMDDVFREFDRRVENIWLSKYKGLNICDELGNPKVEALLQVLDITSSGAVYELTLTSTVDDVSALLSWFDRIVSSKMFSIVAYKACVELTKQGLPHIHAALYTTKPYLNANHIKQKIKFPYRFSLSKVRDLRSWISYLKKGELNNLDLDYCRKHNIPQYWEWSKDTEDENNMHEEKLHTEENENLEDLESLKL